MILIYAQLKRTGGKIKMKINPICNIQLDDERATGNILIRITSYGKFNDL